MALSVCGSTCLRHPGSPNTAQRESVTCMPTWGTGTAPTRPTTTLACPQTDLARSLTHHPTPHSCTTAHPPRPPPRSPSPTPVHHHSFKHTRSLAPLSCHASHHHGPAQPHGAAPHAAQPPHVVHAAHAHAAHAAVEAVALAPAQPAAAGAAGRDLPYKERGAWRGGEGCERRLVSGVRRWVLCC